MVNIVKLTFCCGSRCLEKSFRFFFHLGTCLGVPYSYIRAATNVSQNIVHYIISKSATCCYLFRNLNIANTLKILRFS